MGSIEQINQSITALEQQATDLGEQFYQAYQGYLGAVGQSAQQQLVLAAYQICTEGYPDQFLGMAQADREALQRSLRQLAQALGSQLQTIPHPSAELPPPPPDPDLELLGERPSNRLSTSPSGASIWSTDAVADHRAGDDDDDDDDDSIVDDDDDDDDDSIADDVDQLPEGLAEALSTAFSSPGGFAASGLESKIRAMLNMANRAPRSATGPVAKLSAWQQTIERGAVAQLRNTSQAANQFLQKAQIVPNQVPPAVLEAASQAEGGDPFTKTPHIMNLILEAGPGRGEMMRVMAIKLRLSELEFHDPTVMRWRRQLQELSKQLANLERDYQKQQRAQSVAQAQAAWRSTWLTD
jgi:menaquinone-dependent protoporphyrinogen IX oxidase